MGLALIDTAITRIHSLSEKVKERGAVYGK